MTELAHRLALTPEEVIALRQARLIKLPRDVLVCFPAARRRGRGRPFKGDGPSKWAIYKRRERRKREKLAELDKQAVLV